MAVHKRTWCTSKSMAGAILVALGVFILYQGAAAAVHSLTRILDANGSQVLGILPSVVLAVSKASQAYATGPRPLLQAVLHLLLSSWPLLLVRVGTVLSKDSCPSAKKDYRFVDVAAPRSTLK